MDVILSVPVDERVREEAARALAPLGLTPEDLAARLVEAVAQLVRAEGGDRPVSSDALHAMIERLVQSEDFKSVFFEGLSPIVPNAETVAAIEAARRGEFIGEFRSAAELRAFLDSDAND